MSEAMTDFQFEPQLSDEGLESARERDPLAAMAEQIRLLDEAAARAAAGVGEAADGLRDIPSGDFHSRLLADLGSSVVDRVNGISAECGRLTRVLDRASRLAADRAPSSPSPAPAPDVPEIFKPATGNGIASEPEADAEPEPAPRPAPQPDRRRAPGQTTPEGVRLAATQMAVAGSSRSEIERCLRIQFGVRDADAALDEIFGTRSSEVR